MSLEDQIRMLEGGGVPPSAKPPAGMSIEDQLRMLEGGGVPPSAKPPAGMSIEDQLRMLEGGGMPTPQPQRQQPPREPQVYTSPTGEPLSFDEHLRLLVMEIPGGIAGSIAGVDGIGITSFTNDPDFPLTIAEAEIAAIVGAVKKGAAGIHAGEPHELYFVTDRYGFLVKSIRGQYIVILVLDANELNWGLMRLQINKIIPRIEQELF